MIGIVHGHHGVNFITIYYRFFAVNRKAQRGKSLSKLHGGRHRLQNKVLIHRAQPWRFRDDTQNKFTAHAGNDNVLRLIRQHPVQTVSTHKVHFVRHTAARSIVHGAFQRPFVNINRNGKRYLAALQQTDRHIAVVCADIGKFFAFPHKICTFLQTRTKGGCSFYSVLFHEFLRIAGSANLLILWRSAR